MPHTSIEWTQETWNPTTGCSKVSKGCTFCYAEVMSRRLKAMGVEKYQNGRNGFKLTVHEDMLALPYTWKKSRIVFVNSMSDLFHNHVPIEFIQRVFAVMNDLPQHTFQILTKRADRLSELAPLLTWSDNIWMGVSVENEDVLDRVDRLVETPAVVKFLSCEPLIGPLPNLNLKDIDWVIVGGESGRQPRPIEEDWVEDIRKKCRASKSAFFFKQWGGTNKKKAGRLLNGRTYDEMPKKTKLVLE